MSFEIMLKEIYSNLAQKKKHKQLLEVLLEYLKEGGKKAVQTAIKDAVTRIMEA